MVDTRQSARMVGAHAVLLLSLVALAGCDSVLEPLVGRKSPDPAKNPFAAAPISPPIAAYMSGTDDRSPYVGEQAPPGPTLEMEPETSAEPEPISPRAPHRAIATVPMGFDPAKLEPLTSAAHREAAHPDTHFVLLVLAPPANDAAGLDRTSSAARAAASAAVQAIRDAGVQSDHVEVSMATSPEVGNGEMRLYVR